MTVVLRNKGYLYVLRGPRAGQYGYCWGHLHDRVQTAEKRNISPADFKVGVRFRDGDFLTIALDNLREATPLEQIIEARYGEF